MPKKYTEVEIIGMCKDAIKSPGKFYNAACVNYRGSCSDTGKPYTEIVAEYLIKHFKEFSDGITPINRKSSYCTSSHDGKFDPSSNRKEELIAMEMFNYCQKDGGEYIEIGKIIDYQTPLKNEQDDKAGKIDLLAYNRHDNILRILELKKPKSKETMLRCMLEAYTYSRIVDKRKLIEDFHVDDTCKKIQACPLVFKGSNPHKEYMDFENYPKLHELMKLLDSVPIFIQKGYEIL